MGAVDLVDPVSMVTIVSLIDVVDIGVECIKPNSPRAF